MCPVDLYNNNKLIIQCEKTFNESNDKCVGNTHKNY